MAHRSVGFPQHEGRRRGNRITYHDIELTADELVEKFTEPNNDTDD